MPKFSAPSHLLHKVQKPVTIFFALFFFWALQTNAQTTWYSRTNVPSSDFAVTTAWTDSPSGTGGNDPSSTSVFTSGTDNFVVLSGTTREINSAVTIRSLTVEGTVEGSSGSLTLNGNLINNGTFEIGVPLNFTGADNASVGGAETISVSATITVNKSSGATLTLGANTITISGNSSILFIQDGNFVAGSGTIELDGGADLTISTSGTVDFTTNQSQIDVFGSGLTEITSNQDINFHNIRNSKSGSLNSLKFIGTGGTNFRIRGTYTRASSGGASSISTTSATFGYDGDAATLEYAATNVTTTIGNEFVTASGLEPRNLTINVGSGTVSVPSSSSTNYTVPRNLTLTSGTINLGTGTLTVSGNITGSTVAGSGNIAGGTTLNLGGGSTTTQKQTINGSIKLTRLTIDKRYGNSPNDTEDPRNTVEVSGQLIFNPNGQLKIESGTLQFLTAGGLGGSNLGSLTITIGSSTRRGVLRTGGTDITTGAVGTVNAQQGTNGGNSKVIYDGTTGSNTMRSGAFGVIEIRRDVQVQSNATTTITSELIFHSGTISNTNTNNILVLNDGVPVTYVGTATPQTSYVSGPVQRVISSTTPAVFPVGKGGGGNRVTLTYQDAPSVTVQVEQFNAGVTSANPVPGIFSLSSSRYWDISFASGSTGNNYRLEVDIAGSGIPSPLNRVVFRSSTNPDDYSGGFPTGADVDDNGTQATQAPNFPYTNFYTGRFTLGRRASNLWISRASGDWNDAATWEDENGNTRTTPPSLAQNSDVIIRNGRTVTISTPAEARSLTMDNDGGAGELIINSTLDFSDASSGAQWLSANTDFTAGTVRYQTGNIYGDTYANLEINGATGTQSSNDATPVSTITVTGNLTKLGSTAFTSASSNPITVSGNYTNTAGDATYNGGLTVAGNATITDGNVGGTVTVSGGTLTMNGGSFNVLGGTLTLNNGSSNTINGLVTSPIFNNLVFDIGTGSVTMSGSVQVRGDFTLTGSGNVTNGEIIMNGSNPQAVLGLGSGTIQNFRINNSSSAGVTLNRALSARGTLTLTNGRLNTSATNIMSCTGTSGGSSTAYVYGPLQIGQVGTANVIYPKNYPVGYPVGNVNVYRPFQITTGPNANTLQRVQLINSSPLNAGATLGGGLSAISAFRYWELTDGTGTAAGTQTGDRVVLGFEQDPVDDGINNLPPNPYPLRVAACSTLGGQYSPYGGTDVPSFLGVRGVQSNPLDASLNLRFYTLGSVNASDAPLPVELISFTGVSSRAGVVLSWETASERESAGFVINRRIVGIGSGEWQVIDDYTRNPNLRAKNSLNGAKYTYTDASDLPAGTVLEYRLDEVSFSGAIERLREVRVETRFSTVVTDFALEQNYPNPFNPTTSIPYQLKERAKVTLDIYNTLGQKVATVVDAVQERGNYAVNFNAASLASGMYFYRLTAQGASQTFVQTRKMMLLK
jgi:hypothetical protein